MVPIILAAGLMMFAEATPAAVPATPQPTSVKAAKADKDGKVCRKEALLGSRMKWRVCATAADRNDRKADDRELVEKSQSLKPLGF